jgi:aspartate aminotransferase-like enzyme/GNAT superfamily N-acetyltransferase
LIGGVPDLDHPASACVAASDANAGADVRSPGVRVKIASEPWEFEEIHRLNYRTFVEEIPQHQANADGVLVDRFDRENTYIIALDGRRLLGMIAVRGTRPFSLDAKLPDLDAYLPPAQRVCEFRLLAVDPPHRAGRLLQPLIEALWHHCEARGYDLALISGTTRQTKLYAHLGFVPFGPRVGTPGAEYQPMMLTLAAAQTVVRNVVRGRIASQNPTPVNLLPGPVSVTPAVQTALSEAPASHRSPAFAAHFAAVQGQLRALTGSPQVQLLLGSGTLANDAVAAQLSLCDQRGLILSNGEFGERLADHARRFGLRFATVEAPWGRPIDLDLVERALQERPSWMWFVHLETSSGVVNDATALQAMCAGRGVDVCVDAISALGNVPVDLRGVRLATGVSGKGLGAFPGIALVFHDRPIAESGGRLPRYLDLGLYARDRGVPFTHSSNLVAALEASLDRQDWETRFAAVAAQTRWLRQRLERRGFRPVAAPDHQGPGIVTIALPPSTNSIEIADGLEADGFAVSARSRYLVDRNWLQFSLMGSPSRDDLRGLLDALCRAAC